MPRNEYKELYRDNLRRCGNLQPADRQEIDEVTGLLNKVSFSQYEIERVRQDLIGMAERAEAVGKTLAETLGSNREQIYDAMAREMEPGNFLDWLCSFGSNWRGSYWFAPLHIGSLALSALAGNTATLLLFLLLPIFMLDGFAVSSMQRRIWIGQSPHQLRKGLGAILHIVFLLLLFSCAVWIEWTFPIKVPAWYYIALEICLYLAGRLCCRIRYNRAAARRPWR